MLAAPRQQPVGEVLGGLAAEVLDVGQGAQVLHRVERVDPPWAVRRSVLVVLLDHDVTRR